MLDGDIYWMGFYILDGDIHFLLQISLFYCMDSIIIQISKKSQKFKKSIKTTVRKGLQERKIDPNPTH